MAARKRKRLTVQSLVFASCAYDKRTARAWAKRHGFKHDFVDRKAHTLRIRQHPPSCFVRHTFRTKYLGQCIEAVFGKIRSR